MKLKHSFLRENGSSTNQCFCTPQLCQYVLTLDKAYEMFINRINLKKRYILSIELSLCEYVFYLPGTLVTVGSYITSYFI